MGVANLWIPNGVLNDVKAIMPLEQVIEQDDAVSVARLDNVGSLGKLSSQGKYDYCLLVRLGFSSNYHDMIGIVKARKHSVFADGILFVTTPFNDSRLVNDKVRQRCKLIEVQNPEMRGKRPSLDSFVRECTRMYDLVGSYPKPGEHHLLFYQPIQTA